jgi:hypothetical protein
MGILFSGISVITLGLAAWLMNRMVGDEHRLRNFRDYERKLRDTFGSDLTTETPPK